MNVNLWGPDLWSLLHGLAGLVSNESQLHRQFFEIMEDLRILLPCIHCRNSYNVFFKQQEARDYIFGGKAIEYVYKIHGMVNEKLTRQRLEKTGCKFDPKLINQPTLEVVEKRFLLSNGKPFAESSVWRSLFAFVLAADNEESKGERVSAFKRAVKNLRTVSAKWYPELSQKLLAVEGTMPAEYSSKQGFVVIALARSQSFEEVQKLWKLYKLLPAGSCIKDTCA